MSIRAIIVDDEPLARARLKRLLTMHDVEVVAQGENGQQAIDLVLSHEIDILFIDINMPIKTGLEAASEISCKVQDPPAIVFCTAYDQFAVDAFKTDAVAYLLKPIQANDIANAIEKAGNVNRFQRASLFEKEVGHKTLAVHHQGALQNVPVSQFMYFKSENKHVYAILSSGQELLVDETLKNLETFFIDDFIRIHRAILMNREQASRLVRDDSGAAYVQLCDGDFTLPVSRRHLAEVKKCFQ